MTVFDNGDEFGFASGEFFSLWGWGTVLVLVLGEGMGGAFMMEGREGGRGGEAITMWSVVRLGEI